MKYGIRVAFAVVVLMAGSLTVRAQDESKMLAGFEITVARTPQGVSLTCEKGCTWARLTFSLTSKPTAVNANGMADDKTGNPKNEGLFLLRFGADDKGFTLSCDRGCAWQTLGWIYPAHGKPVPINEYGMAPVALPRKK